MDSLNFTDLVSVESKSPGYFEKIRLTIHRNGEVFIHFREKHSRIVYELQLDLTLYTRVETEVETTIVETQEVEYEILIQGSVWRKTSVPTVVFKEGENATADWINSNVLKKFEKNDINIESVYVGATI